MRYAEIGLGMASGAAFWLLTAYDDARLLSLAGTLATVSGVLFGFLLTSIAMLVSLPDRALVVNMRRTGHYNNLMRGTFQACGIHFAALAVALLAAFAFGWLLKWSVVAALSIEVVGMLRTLHAGRRFWTVLEALGNSA